MPYDCFISYSSSDLQYAEELNEKLLGENFKIWFDKVRLLPGFDWHKEIEQGCENSRVVLAIMTPRWKTSEWTKYETYGAENVIPLIFEGGWGEVSTPPLEKYQAEKIEFTGGEFANWTRLVESIRRIVTMSAQDRTKKIIHLHYRVNDYFIGREQDLIKIHEEFHSNPAASLTQGRVRVISANGGYGKTTLARQYAEKYWRCYSQIFWVDTRLGYETEFAHVHDILYPGLVALTEKEKADRVLNEFCDSTARLLILDNAEDENTAINWIPKTGNCHTLITSRFVGWSAGVKCIPLWLLEEEHSILFLQKRTGRKLDGKELENCRVLAGKLGYLPLALEQASAYIFKQGNSFSFTDYLELFEEAERDLLKLKSSSGSTEYPDTLFSTWRTSIQKMPGGAKAIFRLCSFWAATAIPMEIFFQNAEKLAECVDMISGENQANKTQVKPTKFQIRTWKDALVDYSLVSIADDDSIKIHGLVQKVERLNIDAEIFNTWLHKSIDVIEKYAPSSADLPGTWPKWNLLFPHFLSIYTMFNEQETDIKISLLDSLARYAFGKANYAESLKYEEEAFRLVESTYGAESEKTVDRMLNYGESLRELNYYDKAEDLFRRSLELREKRLGHDHLDVATSLNYLGLLYREKEEYDPAEKYFRDGLDICVRLKITGERTLAKLLLNLGYICLHKDSLDEAESLFNQALTVSLKEFGDKDLLTIWSNEMLGAVFNNRGDYASAEKYLREVADQMENLCGENHPHAISSRRVLAIVLFNQKKYEECIRIRNKLLGRNESWYGKDSDKFIKAKIELAKVLEANNDNGMAQKHLNDVIIILEGSGKFDSDAYVKTLFHLAKVLQKENKLIEANEYYLRLYEKCEEFLKKDSALSKEINLNAADFAVDLNNYALVLRKEKKFIDAEKYLKLAIDFDIAARGEKHPKMAHRLNNLASVFLLDKNYVECSKNLCQAWELRKDSPDITAPRILFIRLLLSLLITGEPAVFIGQLKTVLDMNPLPDYAEIIKKWDINDIFEQLGPYLNNNLEFLIDLSGVLNNDKQMNALDRYEIWKNTPAIELTEPWPENKGTFSHL
jgi:tetratricopeptide (TPR) repeat protein